MQQLLNIRFSFLCRKTRATSEGKNPIVFRVTYRSERRDVFTGLSCDFRDWDADSGRLRHMNKESASFYDDLDLIRRQALDRFDQFKYNWVERQFLTTLEFHERRSECRTLLKNARSVFVMTMAEDPGYRVAAG